MGIKPYRISINQSGMRTIQRAHVGLLKQQIIFGRAGDRYKRI